MLLQRGRDRQRHQWFATSAWPGYPVVNPTLLGSRSAGPMAAAWAIASVLGVDGFRELTASMAASTEAIVDAVHAIDAVSSRKPSTPSTDAIAQAEASIPIKTPIGFRRDCRAAVFLFHRAILPYLLLAQSGHP